jgi:hypothetical protein
VGGTWEEYWVIQVSSSHWVDLIQSHRFVVKNCVICLLHSFIVDVWIFAYECY